MNAKHLINKTKNWRQRVVRHIEIAEKELTLFDELKAQLEISSKENPLQSLLKKEEVAQKLEDAQWRYNYWKNHPIIRA